jgi:hypothetical protein
MGYVSPAVPVTVRLAERLHHDGRPERRFRFTSDCVEEECRQWSHGRCTVLDQVASALEARQADELPRCAIRSSCRWHSQSGPAACSVCPLVVTDQRSSMAEP